MASSPSPPQSLRSTPACASCSSRPARSTGPRSPRPGIFGSLFQAVKDAQAFAELGEHHTTETNILDHPAAVPRRAPHLLHRRRTTSANSNASALTSASSASSDPACGCGNFLVVATANHAPWTWTSSSASKSSATTAGSPPAFFLKEDLARHSGPLRRDRDRGMARPDRLDRSHTWSTTRLIRPWSSPWGRHQIRCRWTGSRPSTSITPCTPTGLRSSPASRR